MSLRPLRLPQTAFAYACLFALAGLALYPNVAMTEEKAKKVQPQAETPSCSCPDAATKRMKPKFAGLADVRPPLTENDEIATLAGIQTALGATADGTTYIWHRHNGRVSSVIQPKHTFRNASGAICRHIVLILTTPGQTQKTEGTACRLADGRWRLDG